MEGASARAALFPTGFAANLGVLTTFGAAGVLICSDELNHASIIDGCRLARGRRRRVPPPRPRPSARAAARPRRPPRARGQRHRVLDGRRRRRRRRARRAVRARARAARARRGPRGARARPRRRTRRRRAARRHAVEDARRARRLRRRTRARYVELVENRARPYIFTTAPTPADTAAALAALRVVRSAEGDALVARSARERRPVATGPSVADRAVRVRRGATRRSTRRPRLLEHGVLVPAIRPPTVAPGTSRLRVTLSAAHTDAQVDRCSQRSPKCSATRSRTYTRDDDRRRRRHRHRDRQDVGHRRVGRAPSAAAASPSRPASRCSRSRPTTPHRPTPTCSRPRPAKTPNAVCPRAPLAPAPDGAADGRRRARRSPPFTIADLAAEIIATRPTTAIVLVESAGGVRSPLAADGDTVTLVDALAAGARRARRRRRARHDQPRAAERRRAAAISASSCTSTASTPTTTCTRGTATGSSTREGLEVVTDLEALAQRTVATRSLLVDQALPASATRSCRRRR